MRLHNIIAIASLALMTLGGCTKVNSDMQNIVVRHIKANMNPGEKLEIAQLSKPDSTFGVKFLPEREIMHLTKAIEYVTEYFMQKTKNMTSYDPNDGYLAYLANRQMLAAAEINELMAHAMSKGGFNGWYVKATYTVSSKSMKKKTEEYFFFDKDMTFIYDTFSIPIP